MKTALLHIGTMKTGNTSIHYSLADATARGLLGPVRYPLWREETHQARMAALYCADILHEALPSLRGRFPQDEKQFHRELADYRRFIMRELRAARDGAILSAEPFCHLFTAEMATALRRDLETAGFERFVVVLYVRDPADYYLSVMNQNLRMSEALPLVKDPAAFRYPFAEMADTWERAFPGALTVRQYPPTAAGDAIADFNAIVQHTFGIALPAANLRRNVSLSAEGMQILQDYRAAFSTGSRGAISRDAADLAQLLLGSAEALAQSRPVLKPELAQQIRHNHRDDLEAIRRKYGVEFDAGEPPLAILEPRSRPYRVDEIVEHFDLQILSSLYLWIAHETLCRPRAQRSLAYRLAARVNRWLPARLRSTGLQTALKRML